MAFTRALVKEIGSTPSIVRSASAGGDVVIGMRITNRTASAIKVAAYISTGGSDYYLVGGPTVATMGADVPVGSSLVVVNGDIDKVVLNSGDVMYVVSSAATSADTITSVLEN